MTTATASSVDIPSDNDLPLSAHLTEPAESTIDMPEIPVAPGNSAQSAAQRLGGKGAIAGHLLQTDALSCLSCSQFWCSVYCWAQSFSLVHRASAADTADDAGCGISQRTAADAP